MKVRLGIDVGYSIQIRGVDWIKPTVHAEVDFDECPSDDELRERWQWLWDTQVAPQSEQLLDMLSAEIARRLGEWRTDPETGAAISTTGQPAPPPSDAVYS